MLPNLNQPSKRILVADDDPVIRHLVTTVVARDGYTVVEASDGDEAYRLLQRDADFGAAVFDMMMPGLKGLELLRFMRTENTPHRATACWSAVDFANASCRAHRRMPRAPQATSP